MQGLYPFGYREARQEACQAVPSNHGAETRGMKPTFLINRHDVCRFTQPFGRLARREIGLVHLAWELAGQLLYVANVTLDDLTPVAEYYAKRSRWAIPYPPIESHIQNR